MALGLHEQLLLGDHSTGREPEHHLRGERLPDERELYKRGALITLAFLAVYLLIGSPWVYFVTR